MSSDILQVAEFSRHVSAHPNLFTVHDVSVEGDSSESPESVDSTVIVVDKLPAMSLSDYVTQTEELHQTEPEKYELQVALMLLQLCSAIHHLGRHHLSLQTIKMEHVQLVQTNGPGFRLVLNHLLSELHYESSEGGKIYLTSKEKMEERTGEFSLGILVYEMLHLASPFVAKPNLITQDYTVSDLPAIPVKSKYSEFLYHLASQFLTKHSTGRLTSNQCALALQTMIWGPQVNNLPLGTQDPKVLEQVLEQWLILEQTQMVNKVAEISVHRWTQQDVVFGLKEQMQCQFLSNTSVTSLKQGLACLYFRKR